MLSLRVFIYATATFLGTATGAEGQCGSSYCPPCFENSIPLAGNGSALNGTNRRLLTVFIDSSWGNPTNATIYNATEDAIGDWNVVTDPSCNGTSGSMTGYYLALDQGKLFGAPSIIIVRDDSFATQNCAGNVYGGGGSNPDTVKLSTNVANSGEGNAAAIITHELGHSLGLADCGWSSLICGDGPSIMCQWAAPPDCEPSGDEILASDVEQSNRNLTQEQTCTVPADVNLPKFLPTPCECSVGGNTFQGTTNQDGTCGCSFCAEPCGNPGGPDETCDSGQCGDNGCCTSSCDFPCPSGDGDVECGGNTCTGGCCVPGCTRAPSFCTDDRTCEDRYGSGAVCEEYLYDFDMSFDACCVTDASGCGANWACNDGGYQCAGSLKSCDPSTGCCTAPCIAQNDLGECPPGTALGYPGNSAPGTTPYPACCVATTPACWISGCQTNADCSQWSDACVDGCCNCASGQQCGSCGWGETRCDGTCDDNGECVCNIGQTCGNCGNVQCDGSCGDPCPNQPGSSCGGCGTYESDGITCDDPCNGCTPDIGDGCGNCGTVACNGSCSDPCACVSNQGLGCGVCGVVQCDGSCNDPCCSPDAGSSCGICGTLLCIDECSDPCACVPDVGDSCGICGWVLCYGSCTDPCS